MQNLLNDGVELSKSDAVHRVMKNNASAALGHGKVVVLDTSDSTGQSVTLPSAEGKPAFGVVAHPNGKDWSYEDQADCVVVVNGVALTNVDGTDNIAAGNVLKIRDTDGVGYKAVAGTDHLSCIFGTALEAYTPNDSKGWINVFVGR